MLIRGYLRRTSPTAALIRELQFYRRPTVAWGELLVVSGASLRRGAFGKRVCLCGSTSFYYVPDEGGEPDNIQLDRRRRRMQELLFTQNDNA